MNADELIAPVVPPKPLRLKHSSFTVERGGRLGWKIMRGGKLLYRRGGKDEALFLVDQIVEASELALVEWHRRYGELVANGKEGVDYRRQS